MESARPDLIVLDIKHIAGHMASLKLGYTDLDGSGARDFYSLGDVDLE
jgi:hypothetical protein